MLVVRPYVDGIEVGVAVVGNETDEGIGGIRGEFRYDVSKMRLVDVSSVVGVMNAWREPVPGTILFAAISSRTVEGEFFRVILSGDPTLDPKSLTVDIGEIMTAELFEDVASTVVERAETTIVLSLRNRR